MDVTDDPAQRVRDERFARGWSVRRAAQEGGVSNQTWGSFENGGPLTVRMREAVQCAFSWPGSWPETPVIVLRQDDATALRQLIALQAVQLEELTSRVEDLDAELRLLRLAVGRAAAGSA